MSNMNIVVIRPGTSGSLWTLALAMLLAGIAGYTLAFDTSLPRLVFTGFVVAASLASVIAVVFEASIVIVACKDEVYVTNSLSSVEPKMVAATIERGPSASGSQTLIHLNTPLSRLRKRRIVLGSQSRLRHRPEIPCDPNNS